MIKKAGIGIGIFVLGFSIGGGAKWGSMEMQPSNEGSQFESINIMSASGGGFNRQGGGGSCGG